MQMLVVVVLLLIVGSLGNALFAMSSGRGDPDRMVRSLTVRIGLSVALFAALMIGWHLGLISPHGVRH
jgi:hypothetical protein